MHTPFDQQLLFGLVALQNGLLDRSQFVSVVRAWTENKEQSLPERLLETGLIDPADQVVLEALVNRLLDRHARDAERSLARRSGTGGTAKSAGVPGLA